MQAPLFAVDARKRSPMYVSRASNEPAVPSLRIWMKLALVTTSRRMKSPHTGRRSRTWKNSAARNTCVALATVSASVPSVRSLI